MLQTGIKAPEFTLPDKDGNQVGLKDFSGKKIVLYFYPKDSTPGCTRQACAFRDSYKDITDRGAVVIGVSKDSEKSHRKFAQNNELPFILLSDAELAVIKAYDVWKEKKMYGKSFLGVQRSTYVIDENGMIQAAMEKVDPDTNAEEVLRALADKA